MAHDSVAVPIICNYVDPAPIRHDDTSPSPPPHNDHQQNSHLLVPPSTSTAAPGGSTTPPTSSRLDIGITVETEVREMKRMLRSFMAKLSQRDARERTAFEWRIVALALDRLFFILYLFIIILSLASMFPWREVFKLRMTAGTK